MKRITFIGNVDNGIETINSYLKLLPEDLCKVPFNNNDDIRKKVDTLPYHFTISAWNKSNKDNILEMLNDFEFSKFKIKVKA